MLFTGYSEAIRAIRLRKKLKQAQCAETARAATRTSIDEKTWSKYETGALKPTANVLPAIAAGLGVSETELWEESVREQRVHYCGRSDQVRGDFADYGPPNAAAIVQGLWALKLDALPDDPRRVFDTRRRDLAALLTTAFNMVDDLMNDFARQTAGTPAPHEEDDAPNDP